MYRLAWTTDVHLNFLRHPSAVDAFARYLTEETKADALLVTGDISEAPLLKYHLEALEQVWKGRLYFVLGNHDYYKGSFADTPAIAREFAGWLEGLDYVELTPSVALVGCEGWYDGFYGLPHSEDFGMSDWEDIAELQAAGPAIFPHPDRLRFLPDDQIEHLKQMLHGNRAKLLNLCRQRSAAFAQTAKAKLVKALESYSQVIFATHYPPFEGACWHEGSRSGDMWVPWFTSKSMGDVLLEVAEQFPTKQVLVLCGHTHSSGIYDPAPNLRVLTGEAVYKHPDLAGTLEITDTIAVTMKFDLSWKLI